MQRPRNPIHTSRQTFRSFFYSNRTTEIPLVFTSGDQLKTNVSVYGPVSDSFHVLHHIFYFLLSIFYFLFSIFKNHNFRSPNAVRVNCPLSFHCQDLLQSHLLCSHVAAPNLFPNAIQTKQNKTNTIQNRSRCVPTVNINLRTNATLCHAAVSHMYILRHCTALPTFNLTVATNLPSPQSLPITQYCTSTTCPTIVTLRQFSSRIASRTPHLQ